MPFIMQLLWGGECESLLVLTVQITTPNQHRTKEKTKNNSKINELLVSVTPLSGVCSLSLEQQPGCCCVPT